VNQLTDVATLTAILEKCHSRGKKQRIKSRIIELKRAAAIARGENPDAPKGQQKQSIASLATSVGIKPSTTEPNKRKQNAAQKPGQPQPKESAKSKVETLLKKRDEKVQRKEQQQKQKNKPNYSEEDKKIMKQQKNKKRAKRREDAKDEDEFDALFSKHKSTILKKLEKENKLKADYEEVEMSD